MILSNREPKGEQAISADTSDVMCELLQTVPISSYGSGYTVQKFNVMCKTGTTDEDMNRWFCAGTPYYVSAIWFGYDLQKNLHSTVNPCGRIFLEVFSRIHRNLDAGKTFPKSGQTIRKAYCANTGLLAGSSCPVGGYGWYKTSDLPKQCSGCYSSSSSDDDSDDSDDSSVEEAVSSAANTIGEAIGNFLQDAFG